MNTIQYIENGQTLYLQRIEGFSVWTTHEAMAKKYATQFDAQQDINRLKKLGGMHLKEFYTIK